MEVTQEEQIIKQARQYIMETVPLGRMDDEALEERIEQVVQQKLTAGGQYCSIQQRISIVQQIFSSIRGFGLLDSIMSDDSITEVMINGHEHICKAVSLPQW